MKRGLYLALSVFLLASLCVQLSAQTPAAQDSLSYRQQLDKLLPLAQSGTRNADLFYNLGVCYYELGQPGKSILYFLRALNIDSSHVQARENIAYIQSLHPSDVQAPRRPFLLQLLLNIYDFFSLNRLALVLLILGLLCTLSAQWLMHYPPEKEHGLPVLVLSILLIFFLITGGTLLLKNHRQRHNPKAVVMREGAPVNSAPSNGKALQYLSEGTILQIKQSSNGWSQVILADGFSGWIADAQLERVVPLKKPAEK